MTHDDKAGKVLLYVITGIALVVGVLVAIAWMTRTPLYTLQAWLASSCDRDLTIVAGASKLRLLMGNRSDFETVVNSQGRSVIQSKFTTLTTECA